MESHKGVKYTCAKCPDKIFTNKQAFQRHEKWHTSGYSVVCAKKDSSSSKDLIAK